MRHLNDRFEMGRLFGRRLVYAPDVPPNFLNHANASLIKSMTGGDTMSLEFKHSNLSVEGVMQLNVLITANTKLTIRLDSDLSAWKRRLIAIPFVHAVEDGAEDYDLSEMLLREEGPGILNWMLEGYESYCHDGHKLILNERQEKIRDEILLASDSVRSFVAERIVSSRHTELTATEAYRSYEEYCQEAEWVPVSRREFGHQIPQIMEDAHRLGIRNDIADNFDRHQKGWKGVTINR